MSKVLELNTLTNTITINDNVDDYEFREFLQKSINLIEDSTSRLKGIKTEDEITLVIRDHIDRVNNLFRINS